ncbi:MAG: nucleotidyl transferase AbiEii/AbiGii toxin family protein [Actinomycetota bacterium]|nr:nucleotidyl transferase AbiEii/AbiGii toxin family protein [Actinomycetota bacterium]
MAFFEETIAALNRSDVRYVVVGGLAVVLHGHARLTVDLDLVVDLDPEEARKAVEALLDLGLVPAVPVEAMDFADPEARARWIEEKNMRVFPMRHPGDDLRRVDLFVEHPMEFSGLWERSVTISLESAAVRVASVPDLVAMKRQAGRLQDLADVEALEAILEERPHR